MPLRLILRRQFPLLLAGLGCALPLAAKAAATAPATACSAPNAAVLIGISVIMLAITSLWQMGISLVIAELTHAGQLMRWCAQHASRRSLGMLTGAGLTALGLAGDIFVWALLLRALNLFNTLESSFYFSAMTFTTVGYGDLVLPECWHLLSVGLALNGLLMAGWSTALLVYVVQHMLELRFHQRQRD